MNKKMLIIIAGVVALILIGAGVFVLTQKDDTSKAGDAAKISANNDADQESKDSDSLGLCTLTDVATIKAALGADAAALTGPNDTGTTGLGGGDIGQTCVYPFVAGGTVSNSFYLDLASYSHKSFADVSDFTATGGTAVSGLGDRASFESSDVMATKAHEFSLTVVKDTKVYIFAISQPEAAVTFTDASAQAALTKIAESTKL